MTNETRKLPTRPGWWLYGNPEEPGFALVCEKDGMLVGLFPNRDRMLSDPSCRWLAEVPPPAECAAWAAAGRPSATVLEAFGEYMRCFRAYVAGGSREYLAASNASAAMQAAIRAELDGDA